MTKAPFGSWRSPISASSIAEGAVTIGGGLETDAGIYWSEQRASEGGRTVVVRDGVDVTTEGFNVRTAVHEYGGGAWWLEGETLYFANWADQRLYRQSPGSVPVAITPEPAMPRGLRYADGIVVGDAVICVRERHVEGREAYNEIVRFPADGSAEPDVLVGGNDFYSNPRVSPDATLLSWLEWTHPNLPWDGTFLYVGDFDGARAREPVLVAGSMDESIYQPQWSPSGDLLYVSDRSGWWNVYRHGSSDSLLALDADFGSPQWVFGQSRYVISDDGDIVCLVTRNASETLCRIRDGVLEEFDLPYTTMAGLTKGRNGRVLFVGAGPTQHPQLVAFDPGAGTSEVIKRTREADPDPSYVSVAEPIEFPSEGRTAHAFFYAPHNADYEGQAGERPPLIVFSHGGPTANVSSSLNMQIQFWTSRGFGVVDVNYGGSTGYGRDYRRLLNGNWGVVDVEDSVNAARYLAARGDVDGDRMAIRGGSAGGFTTLAALVFTDAFKAGANYFGVSDFTPFVEDTHKFESRYLDSLVGPYPERKDLYFDRSPANFVERISAPVITFQGTEDAIVPPSQSERIVNALRENKIPCAYVTYEGEQHGFRQAKNIIHSLESELYFYGRVFGFGPADDLEPVTIENL